jgi:predicted nucleic acid-binding protein
MMNNIVAIDSFQPQEKDKFFFDTNIWMYLYCPMGGYNRNVIKKYDAFLKKVIQARSSIYISSLVLSEFFNAYTRLEFNILKGKEPTKYHVFKKDFRGTSDYKKLVLDIKTTVESYILKLAKRLDDNFSSIDLDDLFEDIEKSDFNDSYCLILVAGENIKVVTNDYDFVSTKKLKVPILTANDKLLKGT